MDIRMATTTNQTTLDLRVVRSHDRPGTGIDDGSLERRQPAMRWLVDCIVSHLRTNVRCAQLSFTTVNWASIESLLGGTEARKVLDHS